MPLDIPLYVHVDFPNTCFESFTAMYNACKGKTSDFDGSLYTVKWIPQTPDEVI
jgi:hypothetical protein